MIRFLAFTLGFLTSSAVFAVDLPRAKPEEVGMSSERLARLSEVLKADIAAGRIPGAVIAVARHGKLVMFEAYGWRDKAAGVAMTADTIFNIASMTKPMTTVGALMLYERGQLLIGDPLSKYFPKFSAMRVAVRDANGEPTAETVPAVRQITIQDLMRHTSGLIYGGRGNTLVHKMYPSGSADASREYDGAAFADKLASLPLLYQPATVWDYGFGLDLLGLTIEQISGQTLGQYLKANLFTPLGMSDTGFSISAEQAARYAKPLPNDPDSGKPQARSPELNSAAQIRMRRRMRGLHRFGLSALCHDVDEPGPQRRSAPARSQNRRLYAVGPAWPQHQESDRQCRSDARRLRFWSGACGADHARRRQDDGIGRTVLLARRQRHRLVGRSKGRACGGLYVGRPRPRSLALSASDQCAGLSGDRRLIVVFARNTFQAEQPFRILLLLRRNVPSCCEV